MTKSNIEQSKVRVRHIKVIGWISATTEQTGHVTYSFDTLQIDENQGGVIKLFPQGGILTVYKE